jgi:predicted nucleic acid-binding protein
MNVRPFFDTNVLMYAFCEGDLRNQTARRLLGDGGVTGVQVLSEFVAIGRRKLGFSWEEVLESLAATRTLCPLVTPLTLDTYERSLRIAQRYGCHIFDALVIARRARCRLKHALHGRYARWPKNRNSDHP